MFGVGCDLYIDDDDDDDDDDDSRLVTKLSQNKPFKLPGFNKHQQTNKFKQDRGKITSKLHFIYMIEIIICFRHLQNHFQSFNILNRMK